MDKGILYGLNSRYVEKSLRFVTLKVYRRTSEMRRVALVSNGQHLEDYVFNVTI